jgi:hypothetical protein
MSAKRELDYYLVPWMEKGRVGGAYLMSWSDGDDGADWEHVLRTCNLPSSVPPPNGDVGRDGGWIFEVQLFPGDKAHPVGGHRLNFI